MHIQVHESWRTCVWLVHGGLNHLSQFHIVHNHLLYVHLQHSRIVLKQQSQDLHPQGFQSWTQSVALPLNATRYTALQSCFRRRLLRRWSLVCGTEPHLQLTSSFFRYHWWLWIFFFLFFLIFLFFYFCSMSISFQSAHAYSAVQ